MGTISLNETPEQALARLRDLPTYEGTDFVREVSTPEPYVWHTPVPGAEPMEPRFRILVDDCGLKYNILRILRTRGCEVIAYPATASADELLSMKPDGVLMSPGPGDPELLDYAVETAKGLVGRVPIMGICLGNQILARAFGGRNYKLKFGHRGGNHPVKEIRTGTRAYHGAESRVRGGRRQPAVGGRGEPHQPERRHGRGSAAPVLADNEHPIPLRGVSRSVGQRVPV